MNFSLPASTFLWMSVLPVMQPLKKTATEKALSTSIHADQLARRAVFAIRHYFGKVGHLFVMPGNSQLATVLASSPLLDK